MAVLIVYFSHLGLKLVLLMAGRLTFGARAHRLDSVASIPWRVSAKYCVHIAQDEALWSTISRIITQQRMRPESRSRNYLISMLNRTARSCRI